MVNAAVTILNDLCIGNDDAREAASPGLAGLEPFHGEAAPFFARPILAIDVDDHRDAEKAHEAAEDGVADAADVNDIGADEGQQQAGDEGVEEGIQGFALDGAETDDAHAAVEFFAERDEGVAVEDGDAVAALDQAGAELLDEGLEAAVGGRDAPRAEEGDVEFPGSRHGSGGSATHSHAATAGQAQSGAAQGWQAARAGSRTKARENSLPEKIPAAYFGRS